MSRQVLVRVPASTSNLGAGFDCIGAAVDLWLSVSARYDHSGGQTVIERDGTLEHLGVEPEADRILLGFQAACRAAGAAVPPGLRLRASSRIPIARGLGSSAAATVAGATAANALLRLRLDEHAIARACIEVEGHADNVAPAIWGGTLLTLTRRGVHAVALPVDPRLALVLAVPDFGVETAYARRVLPRELPHATAAAAAALGAALVRGLATADATLLAEALDDVLHVPFRRGLVRGYDEVVSAARGAGGYGATLSGSGSAIVAVTPAHRAAAVSAAMRDAWRSVGVVASSIVNPAHVGGCTVRVDDRWAPASRTLDHTVA